MRNLHTLMIAAVCIISLTHCGGGGGGSSGSGSQPTANTTSSTATTNVAVTQVNNDYTPNSTLLTVEAKDATDMYVKPDFTFSTTTKVNLLISVHDAQGNIAANTRVRLYALPANDETLLSDGLTDDNLVYTGFTNSLGRIEEAIEYSSATTYLAVTADIMGKVNQAIISQNNNYLSYDF